MCTKLGQQDAEELRAEIKSPKVPPPPKPNLTKAQSKTIRELKRDRDYIVLTTQPGTLTFKTVKFPLHFLLTLSKNNNVLTYWGTNIGPEKYRMY